MFNLAAVDNLNMLMFEICKKVIKLCKYSFDYPSWELFKSNVETADLEINVCSQLVHKYGVEVFEPQPGCAVLKCQNALLSANDDWSKASITLLDGQSDGLEGALIAAIMTHLSTRHGMMMHSSLVDVGGKGIMFIGPSGQGKTTTLRILLGLYHPKAGAVTVSNPGYETIPISSGTRCLFSYIPQGNTLFSGTIADNMKMLRPDASDEEIIEVLKTACAWEFVTQVEKGIHTEVSEGGNRFSEGQKQRLSIARALMAKAPVLLLDEATSALDMVSERKVLKNILRRDPLQTIIVTAHRPSVLSICDRVYKIQEGRIDEVNEEEIEAFLNEV